MGELLAIHSWDEVPRTLRDGAVLLEIDGTLPGDPARGLARLAALDVPVVGALSGAGDASLLAAALSCAYAAAAPSLTVDCGCPRTVLALGLGLPRLLAQRGAASLLFGPQPLSAERLAAAGLVSLAGDARAIAQRLAGDPGAALLVRSLKAAARSSAAQAAAYDRELLELL
jgi:enoyl-CoA hydratase/carnithine racemase